MFWESESIPLLVRFFFLEFSFLNHIIRIKNKVRWAFFVWDNILFVIKFFLIIDFRCIWVPFTQKIDYILDDLAENLFFALELWFEFFLKSSVFTGQKLILLIQTDTDLLELVLVRLHLIDFGFEWEINTLRFETDCGGNFVCLLEILWNAWE